MVSHSRVSLAGKLAILALALAACAAPTAVPTQPPTATVLPPTAVPTLLATATLPATTATAVPATAAARAAVPATSFRLSWPTDVAFDAEGNMFISQCSDEAMPQILKVDNFGLLTVYASPIQGSGGDGGPALAAGITCATGLAFDGAGNLFISDYFNHRIRRIDRNGLITTVAGSGPDANFQFGLSADGAFAGDGGPATEALLWNPSDVAIDAEGNLYLVDAGNYRIRKVDAQGVISTVAGTGVGGFAGDGGPATAAQINTYPGQSGFGAIAFDAGGNLYLADSGNARIRRIDTEGIITTVAGDGGPQVAGDGGPAIGATLARPLRLAFDADGNLYVADSFSPLVSSNLIRKIDRDGLITTVAGTGVTEFSGDGGQAILAGLYNPWGLALDASGNLYVVDSWHSRVRRVDSSGIITTVAGGRP